MKKKCLFMLFLFFICIPLVKANHINSIDMDIYIDKYGNAIVNEVWDVYLDSGTEGYRNYTLTDNINISNFSVMDDTGREYKKLDKWNTSASFQIKAYTSGINKIYDGVELCWGISQYGNRKYTLKYNINNFVNQYVDNQGIYFNLLNIDQTVDKVNIEISSDIPFSLDNAKIWGFGYKGNVEFINGKILMKPSNKLKDNQYMVLLVRFDKDIFDIETLTNKSFDDIYNEAMSDISFFDKIIDKFYNINGFQVIIIIFILFFLYVAIVNRKPSKKRKRIYIPKYNYGNLYFSPSVKTLPNDDDIPFYNNIPCNKDLCYAYWVCYQYQINLLTSTLKEGFIGAILLKWIRDGYIKVIKVEKSILNFNDNNYAIEFVDNIKLSNPVELELSEMLKNSSSDGKILKSNEFASWCEENYSLIINWFDNIIVHTSIELKKKGLIKNRIRKVDSKYSSKKKVLDRVVSIKVKHEAIKLKGLKKYFMEFTSMNEKEYFDVHLWEEYLMFAQLLGVAEKVSEQFSKLYPEFVDIDVINVINSFSRKCYAVYGNKISSFNKKNYGGYLGNYNNSYSGSSRISGSGGRSYNGGGRSAGGSSGGGFR